ncbi:hypothetical protein CGLO_14615 [Colletotrichum gloeosporioides Cg-14]|uniref:Uncharacterized protein n=1 Tax=Colletotrichum gloeosporioides (strain Cg-14) TaxID=1237896 RepID=T0L3W6_COLGC|nr:hypothetical protein CGLO_14615 [Colletotrichum gloeosporioides Cg-14]
MNQTVVQLSKGSAHVSEAQKNSWHQWKKSARPLPHSLRWQKNYAI